MIDGGGATSNNFVTGLFRRLIDLALADDLLALDAAGLAAAVEEVDVAELPQRIGELASTWVAKALADVHEDDRPAAAQQLATELMATINRTTADPLLAQDEALASPISELTAIEPLDPTGNIIPIKRPLTPIGDTVLLTNARGEPAQDQTTDLTPFDITPYPFQKAMLEQLQVERRRGRPHSLVVASQRYRQDGHGHTRLPPPAHPARFGQAAVHRPSQGDPAPEPHHLPPCAA